MYTRSFFPSVSRLLSTGLLLVGLIALTGCSSGGSGMDDSDNSDSGGNSGVDVTVTIDNVGSDAWEVTDVEGASGVNGGGENPTLTLETGTRYRFVNNGWSTHPLGFQNSSDEYLLNQNEDEDGSFEGDSDVNYEEDSDGVTFTYTQSLADATASYRCTVHPSMEGTVGTDSSGDDDGDGDY